MLGLVALLAAAAFVGAYYYFNRPRHPKPWVAAPRAPRAPEVVRVALERQIELLRDAGLALGASVTVDDLLHSFPREEYEDDPYALLLIMYGAEIEREPFGRRISAMAWDFDLECIEGPGGYVAIVEELARLTGRPDLITEVTDAIDMDAPVARVAFAVGGVAKAYEMRIDGDWADPEGVTQVMHDIAATADDGRSFWGVDNGQAIAVFFIADSVATKVNAIAGEKLRRL